MIITGTDILGLIGGFIGSICALPQLILMFQSRSAKDISSLFTLLYFISLSMTSAYMTLKSAWAGAIALWIETMLAFILLAGKMYFSILEAKQEEHQKKKVCIEQDSDITIEISLYLEDLAEKLSTTMLLGMAQNPNSMVKLHSSPSSAKLLSDILCSNNVYVGMSSMGKDFCHTAKYYLKKKSPTRNDSLARFGNDNKKLLLKQGLGHCARNPLMVIDIGTVVSQMYQWRMHFPCIDVFFAMRGHSDPLLVKALAAMGCHFDCASLEDISLVKRVTRDLSPPYNSAEILYANEKKSHPHMIEAVGLGVNLVAFDNEAEVKICASISKQIKLVMRIIIDDSASQCNQSSKFGAPRPCWPLLLKAARQHDLEIVGVSFHVGSGYQNVEHCKRALKDAKALFDMAQSEEFGFKMNFLDIGGGFPTELISLWNPEDGLREGEDPDSDVQTLSHRWPKVKESGEAIDEEEAIKSFKSGLNREVGKGKANFISIADVVIPMLDDIFPDKMGVRIIAKPGQHLVAASSTKVTSFVSIQKNIVNKKVPPIKIFDTVAAMHVHTRSFTKEDEAIEAAGQGAHHHIITSNIHDMALLDEGSDVTSSYHSCDSTL